MGGILIVLVALAAFALGAAIVLLVTVYRRSEQHRAALLQAYARIDQLERMMKALTFGELPAPPVYRKIGAAAAEPPSKPPPPPETAPPPSAPAPAPAMEIAEPEPTVAERIARAEPPEPPQLGLAAAFAGLAALAALACVRTGVIDPIPGLALAALAGAGAIAFAEWRRAEQAAPILEAFGCVLIAAAVIVARITPGGLAPLPALVAAGALALAALLRARAKGPWLIAFGLLCAAAAPALALQGALEAHARHAVLLLVVACAFALSRLRAKLLWLCFALAAALGWGAFAAARAPSVDEAISAALFLAALALAFIAQAWSQARESARPIGDPRARARLFLGMAGAASALALLAWLGARHGAFAPIAAAAMAGVTLAAATAAAFRPGLAPLPCLRRRQGPSAFSSGLRAGRSRRSSSRRRFTPWPPRRAARRCWRAARTKAQALSGSPRSPCWSPPKPAPNRRWRLGRGPLPPAPWPPSR